MNRTTAYLIAFLTFLSCAGMFGDESFPKEIKKVSFAQGFWDGGSIVIEFQDEASIEWKLFYDQRLEAPEEEYNTISLGQMASDEESLVPLVPQTEEKEKVILEMVKRYFLCLEESDSDEYVFLKQLLTKKNQLPNKTAPLTPGLAPRR